MGNPHYHTALDRQPDEQGANKPVTPVRIMLATLCLNEREWIDKLYRQHANWPGVVGWAFVEGADPTYRSCNPEMVSASNGSVDGTTEYLKGLSRSNGNVSHLQVHHVPQDGPTDQAKCYLRNAYWSIADAICPDWVVQLDADEFYSHQDQQRMTELLSDVNYEYDAFMFRQRHIWKPPCPQCNGSGGVDSGGFTPWGEPITIPCGCFDVPLLSHEVVGGYWQVPHTRVWRWRPGTSHKRNHNWPEKDGKYLTENMLRCDLMDNQQSLPQCVHLGYASSGKTRKAKHDYYVARGEGSEQGRLGRRRRVYLDCREAWENWDGFRALPHGARVRRYDGPKPECFR